MDLKLTSAKAQELINNDSYGLYFNRNFIDRAATKSSSQVHKIKRYKHFNHFKKHCSNERFNWLYLFRKLMHTKDNGLKTLDFKPLEADSYPVGLGYRHSIYDEFGVSDVKELLNKSLTLTGDSFKFFEYLYTTASSFCQENFLFPASQEYKVDTEADKEAILDNFWGGFSNMMKTMVSLTKLCFEMTLDEQPHSDSPIEWNNYGKKVLDILRNSYKTIENFADWHIDFFYKFMESRADYLMAEDLHYENRFAKFSKDDFQLTKVDHGEPKIKLKAKTLLDLIDSINSKPYIHISREALKSGQAIKMLETKAKRCFALFVPMPEIELANGKSLPEEHLLKETYDWFLRVLDDNLLQHLDKSIMTKINASA